MSAASLFDLLNLQDCRRTRLRGRQYSISEPPSYVSLPPANRARVEEARRRSDQQGREGVTRWRRTPRLTVRLCDGDGRQRRGGLRQLKGRRSARAKKERRGREDERGDEHRTR